jgi:hypothetical protein
MFRSALTFGAARDRTSIFATNDDPASRPNTLPGVIEVNVGVPGASPR